MKLPQLSACFVSCVVLGTDASANSWSDSTTVLVYNFGRSVQIPEADGNGQITDGDFVHWLSDYMFSLPVQDENADGVVNYTDVVLTVEGTLKSLASDFNRNDVVDTDDFANVLQNLGTTEPDADKGDLNADGAVDSNDLIESASRVGETPTIDPSVAAADLLRLKPVYLSEISTVATQGGGHAFWQQVWNAPWTEGQSTMKLGAPDANGVRPVSSLRVDPGAPEQIVNVGEGSLALIFERPAIASFAGVGPFGSQAQPLSVSASFFAGRLTTATSVRRVVCFLAFSITANDGVMDTFLVPIANPSTLFGAIAQVALLELVAESEQQVPRRPPGIAPAPVGSIYCYSADAYIDCTDDCEDTYDTCLPNCRAAYQLCKDAAELVLQTCEGSCSGNCDSSVGCAARCLGCRVVFGAQMSMCLAMLTGCMTGCELGLTTCFSGCYLGSIQSFPGAVCPPGWIPVF